MITTSTVVPHSAWWLRFTHGFLHIARNALALIPLVGLVAFGVVASALPMALAPDGIGMRISNACFHLWSRWTLRAFGIRVWVKGAEHLAARSPCVVAVNHRSLLDVPVVGAVLGIPLCGVYKRSLGRVPIFGQALWLSRSVGIDRNDHQGSVRRVKLVAQRMAHGRSLLIFPEGRRSTGPDLLPFRAGAVMSALEQHADILPVTVVGTGALYPRGKLLLSPGDVLVVIHPPVVTAGRTAADRGALNARLQEQVASAFQPGRAAPALLQGAVRMV